MSVVSYCYISKHSGYMLKFYNYYRHPINWMAPKEVREIEQQAISPENTRFYDE